MGSVSGTAVVALIGILIPIALGAAHWIGIESGGTQIAICLMRHLEVRKCPDCYKLDVKSGPANDGRRPPSHRDCRRGAAGLELATKLGERLGRRQRAHIALVDRSRTHIWKPLLHSVAAGSLRRSQHELNYIAQAHWHHFRYRNGEMTGLDRVAKTITLAATRDDEDAKSARKRRSVMTPS